MNFKFVIPAPDRDYYAWQILVQLNNFKRLGYDKDLIYLIGYTGEVNKNLQKIIDSKEFECRFIMIKDERLNKRYAPSMKPYLMKYFIRDYPEYKDTVFFYTDPDVLFIKKMDFSKYLNDDIWYLSDTRSYLNSKYIIKKGKQLFFELCIIANIESKLVIDNDDNAGGAQWIIKNTDYEYWHQVEKISNHLYSHMERTKDKHSPRKPIQSWTAEMWATLWIAWKNGIKTKIDKDLKFCWANHSKRSWDRLNIYHNAGATSKTGNKHFKKTDYKTNPFNKILIADNESASINYIKEIKDTEINYKKLIW